MGRTKTNRGATAKNLTFTSDKKNSLLIIKNSKEYKFIKNFIK